MTRTRGRRVVRGLAGVPNKTLERELERRRMAASELESKRATLLRELASLEREIRTCAVGAAPSRTNAHARNGNRLTLSNALVELLTGRTMHVTAATEAVQKAGYKSRSKDLRLQVNAELLRSGKFRRVGWGQYTAK